MFQSLGFRGSIIRGIETLNGQWDLRVISQVGGYAPSNIGISFASRGICVCLAKFTP